MKKWYKLDNIGKFYSSLNISKIPKVFRYSAVLKEEISEELLQIALNKTVQVYPNFNVNLRKGFYWYYLNETNKINKITKENLPICFKIYNNSDDFLYRVSYYKNKINFEVSHILSDGRGSVEFFKLLLTNYISIKYNLKISNSDNKSLSEKSEDSYSKYYKKYKITKKEKVKSYQFKSNKYKNQTMFLECNVDVTKVLDIAHKYNTTLTTLLVSILIYSFKDELKLSDMNKYIKIDLPVDLRSYFKSNSIMNFFGLTTIKYKFDSKEDTLERIIKSVNKQFNENITKEKLSERANMMVSFEKNIFCRFTPIVLKNIVLSIIDSYTSLIATTTLSNIGIIKFDKEIENYINSISVLTSTNGFQFTICTFKKNLCIGISNRYITNDVIKNFCRYFTQNDINMKVNVSEVE